MLTHFQESPSWGVNSQGDVFLLSGAVKSDVTLLTDADIIQASSMWKKPHFLGSVFMRQARRLGFTPKEIQDVLGSISKKEMPDIIEFFEHHTGYAPNNSGQYGAVIQNKLPSSVESYEQLIFAYLHTPGIIGIYPTRCRESMHVYSVLNHEINHLLMIVLYLYRNQRSRVPLDKTIQTMVSPVFNEITETLAWLDGGQTPMDIGFMDGGRVAKYVGWNEGGKYDGDDGYEMAKLRAFRVHSLQIKIHNLHDTSLVRYQIWCRKIREILFLGINEEKYLRFIDEYLDSYSHDPKSAREQLFSIH